MSDEELEQVAGGAKWLEFVALPSLNQPTTEPVPTPDKPDNIIIVK